MVLLIVGFNVFWIERENKINILLTISLGEVFFELFKVQFEIFFNKLEWEREKGG